jgi:Fe-S cluster assembly protein SufD
VTATSTTDLPDKLTTPVYPTKRDEAWRYAPHRELARLSFGPINVLAGDLPNKIDGQIPVLEGPRIVVVNGVVDHTRSDLSALPSGLQLSAFADARRDQPKLFAAHADRSISSVNDAFAEHNRAFAQDGAIVHVAGGHDIHEPIHIVDVTLANNNTTNAACSHLIIRVDDGASATVVETRIGAGGFGGSNTQTTISLGDEATLDHIVLQDVPSTQVHLSRVDVTQGAQSSFRGHLFNLGGSYARAAYDVHLAGQGANADLSGLYFGTGEQTLDQQVTIVHGAPDCTSRQTFRGILDHSSTGVFNGGIDVRPGADGTDAEQTNNNLLLSDQAEANTQPRLEILADDVTCKHGATVGQLDDDAIYYLRTRGIPHAEARKLLVHGFAHHLVDGINNQILQDWISERLGDLNG